MDSIYLPRPNSKTVRVAWDVQLGHRLHLQILNLTGQVVQSLDVQGITETELNLYGLDAGLYLVQVMGEGGASRYAKLCVQ